MRCQQREEKERSGNVIREMAALRWEPTHVTKHCPRIVPLHYLPRVVFSAKTLPLDQELKPPPVPATI